MAVMTSQLMDKPAFEAKAPPVSSADLMALDSDINGHSHDALFEESHTSDTVAQPPPTMNGDHHALEPEEIEPVTHVTSGIAPTAPFKPETEPVANTSLLLDIPEPPVAPISLPPAIEAPLSDLRQDITAEQTESLPVQEESAPAAEATQSTVATEPDASQDDSTAPATQDNTMGTTISAPDDDTQPAPPAAELPEPSSSDAPPASEVEPTKAEPAEADQEMTDAPPSGKIRAREEDEGEGDLEPSAKRTKVEEEELAADTGVAEASETAQPPGGEAAAPGLLTKASSSDPLWPTFDAEPITPQQQSTLLQRIRNARKIKAAGPFNKPVDWVALNIPNYPEVVKEPMDLGTVENKLKASQYPTVDAFLYDLNLMVRNCYTFNGREHPVSHLAADLERYVTAIFPAALDRNGQGGTEAKKPKKPIIVTERKETRRKSMATQQATAQQAAAAAAPPTPVAAPAPPTPATAAPPAAPAAAAAAPAAEAKSPVASVTSPSDRFALQPDGTPTIRRDSTTQDGRPKRQIQKPKPKDLPYSVKPKKKKFELELKFCEQILNEVRKKQHSRFVYAFLYPVDPVALNIPHYHKVIKKPMDIQTIDQKLHRGEYATSKEFKSDFDLMLANCFKFNPETDEVHQMGKQVKELFNGLWAGKDAWMEEHQPQSEAHSASADEDDDEEEESSDEDEEDSQQRDLVAIQQQIAELTSRAQTIIQSGMKRVSPKVKGEKKKGKGGAKASGEKKKKGAGGSSGAGAKVAALKTKKTKVVPLTFAQKQEISETISTLDEPNMRKAVQIIRNGVPSLRGVNDEELEIDMDLIPDEVLRELYKFLRGTRPKAAGSAMDVSDDEFEMPKHHRAPKGSGSGSGGGGGGGAKRKNKPMGKKEQEESIRQIQRQLESFKNPGADGDELMGSPPLGGGRDETSSDDDGESESEEE